MALKRDPSVSRYFGWLCSGAKKERQNDNRTALCSLGGRSEPHKENSFSKKFFPELC